MRMGLARAVVALAAQSLGPRRETWGQAMQAELEPVARDGSALSFALGCLFASWRELPAHIEGRIALTAHLLAVGVIVPVAGMLLWCGLLGYPYLAFGHVGVWGFFAGKSEQLSLLNEGDWAVAPSLSLLVLVLAANQLLLAWFVLERDWTRVAAVGRFSAASVTTLAIVMALLGLIGVSLLLLFAGLSAEMLAALALARWQDRQSGSGLLRLPGG